MTASELKRLLVAEIHNEAAFAFVNTSLILRTGVNLNQVDGEIDPRRLEDVMREIRAMGFLKESHR